MQALPPGAARSVYAFPKPATVRVCKLLHAVFGAALQAWRGGYYWVLGVRCARYACTVLAVHEVDEARRSDRHRDLATFLAEYPREQVYRCVHERDLERVLKYGVLEGLDDVDACLTSDVWLALEGACPLGPRWHLLVFELAVGGEAVAPYDAGAECAHAAGAHVCTVVNAERTLFRPLYPDQLLLHMVLELEVCECKAVAPEQEHTPLCNPALDIERARENALAGALGSTLGAANVRALQDAPFGPGGKRANAPTHAGPLRADVGRAVRQVALGLDFCTDASCALLHGTEARLCAGEIFSDTDTSPVADVVGCECLHTAETYACNFVPQFSVCGKPAQPAEATTPDTKNASARGRVHESATPPRTCPDRGGARTLEQSPNVVCC